MSILLEGQKISQVGFQNNLFFNIKICAAVLFLKIYFAFLLRNWVGCGSEKNNFGSTTLRRKKTQHKLKCLKKSQGIFIALNTGSGSEYHILHSNLLDPGTVKMNRIRNPAIIVRIRR